MGMASWRGRVAHLASPWQWGQAAFAVFVVGVLALSVAVLVRAATGPVSTSGKVVIRRLEPAVARSVLGG
ncbi:MAG: hypothetical protein QOD57_5477 [Actinomycetota bacterium]|nr:hypothetical protein [Actinomycetota bacterium]